MILNLRRYIPLLTVLFAIQLSGCSVSSTFLPYPAQIEPLKVLLSPIDPQPFSQLFLSERSSNDKILYNLEHGRLAQLFGYTEVSQTDFAAAIETIRVNEQRATVSASRVGANFAAILTNDNALPYEGEGYERVLVHHYQALNYLLQMNLEGAGVEFRWANAEQEEALKRHEHEVEKAQEKAAGENFGGDPSGNSTFVEKYAQLNEISGRVKNSFQNAYSFYLSGLIYELQGELNDAYIDYKKALEIYPENRYLQRDVISIAKSLGMSDDLVDFANRFPQVVQSLATKSSPRDTGELILIFEDGFVPARQELKLAFPLPDGLTTLALPFYHISWSDTHPLELQHMGLTLATTEPICDIRVLAVKSLQEKMPIVLVRQLVRAVTKLIAQKEAKERLGPLGQFATMAYSLISENADLRSWLTLPENVQFLRVNLPARQQNIYLTQPETLSGTSVDIDIKANGKTFLYVVKSGNRFYAKSVVF